MANFNKAMKTLLALEFNRAEEALHKNKNETGFTYMGIYRSAHQGWQGWKIVDSELVFGKNIKEISKRLFANIELTKMVYDFYNQEFWNKMRLDEINSQQIADEMFIFGVNTQPKTAIKTAQKLVEVAIDGIIGPKTIKVLNCFDENVFSVEFDKLEIEYYEKLALLNPAHKVHLRGWRNRANAI